MTHTQLKCPLLLVANCDLFHCKLFVPYESQGSQEYVLATHKAGSLVIPGGVTGLKRGNDAGNDT